MSGRRLRISVRQALEAAGVWTGDSVVVVAGLTNHYSHYIATYEEYQAQRYEASSTLYGPATLAAYQQEYTTLATYLAKGVQPPSLPTPAPDTKWAFLLVPDAPGDELPNATSAFGAVARDVTAPSFALGDTVSATFVAGNPNNNLSISTYCTIEQYADDEWQPFLDDGEFGTIMRWQSPAEFQSLVECEWTIPSSAPATPSTSMWESWEWRASRLPPHYRNHRGILGNTGAIFSRRRGLISIGDVTNSLFRIVHSGYSKSGTDGQGATAFYQGFSSNFTVTSSLW